MNLHRLGVDLQHLEFFIAVAEERNFTHAAERLHTTQPQLSNKIKALEKKVDGLLLNRKKRPLELTQAGSIFLAEARSILIRLEQAIHLTQKLNRGEVGNLNIGFTSSIANGILPDILNAFRTSSPEVKLNCRQMACDDQIEGLLKEQLDVAFFHPNEKAIKQEDLNYLTVLTEPLVLILPEDHPLRTQSTIPLQVLANERFVLPTRQSFSGLSEQIHLLLNRVGFVPHITQEATNMITVLGLVAGGMGISLLPTNVLNLKRKGVIYKDIEGFTSTIRTMMFWHRHSSSNILRQFREVARTVSQSE
ncbi:MAG: LysR family transcriptional regulator [Cyanophyceae cyanobacterium]